MIEIEYNQIIDVTRLTPTVNNTEEYDDHLSSVRCSIQPLDDSFNEDQKGSFGKDRLMFCAVVDIKENDKVLFDGTTYRVVAVESFNDFRRQQQQMEILIREYIE